MAEKDLVLTSFKDECELSESDSLGLAAEALEDDKIKLKARVSDFESDNLKAVEDALRKEEVIKSMNMDLNIERGQSIIAQKTELDDAFNVKEALENWKKEVDIQRATYRALTRERENDMAYLKELVFAKEKADAVGIVEKERVITLEQDDEINRLKEELKTAREKAVNDVANLKEKIREALAQQEEVNASLKEELKFTRKHESAVCEIGNMYASGLKEFSCRGRINVGLKDKTSEIENFKSIESAEKKLWWLGEYMTDG